MKLTTQLIQRIEKLAPGDLIAVQNFVLALQAKAVRPSRSRLLTGRSKARNALALCRDSISETIIAERQEDRL
ncbi:MAG: hypothetical protein Q7J38_04705 [Gallionella sp.]|nr:hypothetical protein [Gallionella sp.]